jgi:hypothetical protein
MVSTRSGQSFYAQETSHRSSPDVINTDIRRRLLRNANEETVIPVIPIIWIKYEDTYYELGDKLAKFPFLASAMVDVIPNAFRFAPTDQQALQLCLCDFQGSVWPEETSIQRLSNSKNTAHVLRFRKDIIEGGNLSYGFGVSDFVKTLFAKRSTDISQLFSSGLSDLLGLYGWWEAKSGTEKQNYLNRETQQPRLNSSNPISPTHSTSSYSLKRQLKQSTQESTGISRNQMNTNIRFRNNNKAS